MARSTYVYVVQADSAVVAAFTVKHELVTALKRHGRGGLPGVVVVRVPDGDFASEGNTVMNLDELLGDS